MLARLQTLSCLCTPLIHFRSALDATFTETRDGDDAVVPNGRQQVLFLHTVRKISYGGPGVVPSALSPGFYCARCGGRNPLEVERRGWILSMQD